MHMRVHRKQINNMCYAYASVLSNKDGLKSIRS